MGDLLWQTTTPISDSLHLQARIVDWLGRPVSEQTIPVAPTAFPESSWQTGDLVRTRLAIPVPYRLDGQYRVQISLIDDKGITVPQKSFLPGSSWTTLGTVTLEDWPQVDTVPPDSTTLTDRVTLGEDNIQLEAYTMERISDTLQVDLYWRNNNELDKNYGTFVHIGLPGEAPQAQGGGPDWERPVQSWREGEIVKQSFTIVLPENLNDNSLLVQAGMYDVENPNQRLLLRVNGIPSPENAYVLRTLP